MNRESDDLVVKEVRWTEGALKRMERAPAFLHGMVRRLAEKKARELRLAEINEETLDQFKSQMMGGMGGASGMAEAAEAMAQGRLPWTAAAKERLNTVPEFMRGMIKQIAEEVAKVNPDLVVRHENGEIYTVRYDAVNAMLLNEFLKEHRKVEKLEATVAALAAQIEKLSTQRQTSTPATQVAVK